MASLFRIFIPKNIADEVWPNGWHGECHVCGKKFYYTREECAYYLTHGWPKCDHQQKAKESEG